MEFSLNISVDTIIGLIALLLAIGSALYTWHSNKYSVELSNLSSEYDRKQNIIKFTIINTSNRPIRVQNVKVMKDRIEIKDNGFDPVKYDKLINEEKAVNWKRNNTQTIMGIDITPNAFNPFLGNVDYSSYLDTSNPFENDVFLSPSDSVSLSYYVDELPNRILIFTDKRIFHFKRNKSFSIDFYQHD